MNVIITGASGMIGKLILDHCLESDQVKTITSISRKSLGCTNPKLIEIIHADFLDFSAVKNHFKNQDLAFYCLGVYTGQVSTQEFKKITVDFTRSFAETIQKNSPKVRFCFLSGAGADSTETSNILFARQKGIAENNLQKQLFNALHIFRPGYIYPVQPRLEPNWTYRLFRKLYKPLSAIYPNIGIASQQLADKIFEVGLNGSRQLVYENRDIRA